MSNRVRTMLIVIVAFVWGANFTAPVFVHDFQPAPELNVAFMAIIGVLTSSYKRDEKREDDKEKRERENRARRNQSRRKEIDK